VPVADARDREQTVLRYDTSHITDLPICA
jgi:hypothetical protein